MRAIEILREHGIGTEIRFEDGAKGIIRKARKKTEKI